MIGDPVWIDGVNGATRSVGRLAVFAGGVTLGAVSIATALGWAGQLIFDASRGVAALVLGLVSIAVILRETVHRTVALPQLRWQVPRHWLEMYWRGAFVFGVIIGMGVLTLQQSALFHLYMVTCFLGADPTRSAVMGLLFSAAYMVALSTLSVAHRGESPERQYRMTQRIGRYAILVGVITSPLAFSTPMA